MFKWIAMHWPQLITAVVAIYGAILATLNHINYRKEKRRLIQIKMSWGLLAYPETLSDPMFLIDIANPGYRPVTVNTPCIRLPSGESLIFPWPTAEVRFPYELQEGKNCMLWAKESEIIRSLKQKGYSGKIKLRAEVHDQTGKKYKSKKAMKLNLNK